VHAGGVDPDAAEDAAEPLLDRLAASGVGGMTRLLRRLPEATARSIATAGARVFEHVGGQRIADARVNLRIAFPQWSEARRREVLTASLVNLGRGLVEFARMSVYGEEEIRERVRLEGVENYEKAVARSPKGGVIAMTAHFGNWELLSTGISARGYPISVVHRARDNRAIDDIIEAQRGVVGAELLPRGSAARRALRALRDGRILALPYDQNVHRDQGVFVPFFGRMACARTAPVRLAMRTGAPVLPAFLHREADDRHVARIYPMVELVPEGDDPAAAVVENARRMTRVIEEEIRKAPEEWIWIHRRWRTQPPGEPRPYS
jgi:KDO2-lipid IV(A) lauroyltransferase